MPLVNRAVKGSKLTAAELDGNFQYLESLLAPLPPVTITGTALTLNAAEHANRLLICTNASPVLLSLSNDAEGGWDSDDSINVLQSGTGSVTIIAGTATLRSPPGTTAVTTARYKLVGSTRIGANEWTLTETVASSGGGASASGRANNRSFLLVPENSTGSSVQGFGIQYQNTSGTQSAVTLAGTNAFTEKPRRNYLSAAAVQSGVGFFTDAAVIFGNQYFSMEIEFGSDDVATTSRNMIGVAASPSGIGGAGEMTADFLESRLVMGNITGGTEFSIYHNDNSGVPTAIPLGSDFPVNSQGSVTGVHYRFRIDYYPASDLGGRRAIYTVTNLGTGIIASGTLLTNIPAPANAMRVHCRRDTAGGTTPVNLAFMYAAAGAYL